MKFCPECGTELISQKFCHECGCNIQKYQGSLAQKGTDALDSFDFSAMESEAQKQLNEQNEREEFYKNAEVEGTTLVKYTADRENVVIPEGITQINRCAFYKARVKSITVPASVSVIEAMGLVSSQAEEINVSEENKHFKSVDGIVYSKDGRVLVQYPNGKRGYYSMPNEIERVERFAISGCTNMTGLTLSSRLTKIDDFMLCGSAFQTITIPSSITSIGMNAFEMCSGLSSITIPGNVCVIGENAFSSCYNLRSVSISEGVVSIDRYAFFNCTCLSSVTLPSSLNVIGERAFQQCKSLSSIIVPRGVSTINVGAFAYCESLCDVTIEEGVKRIESEAFNNYCLKSVKIPRSVESISNSAFPTIVALVGGFKMYVPRGRRYGLDLCGREFIDY